MKKQQFVEAIKSLFDEDIYIFLQTKGGKWYEQEYQKCEEVLPGKVYGVRNGDVFKSIDYDFKAGKTEDGLLKGFISQYISKWEAKKMEFIDGQMVKKDKKEILEKIKNQDRVYNWIFYTTLYGIGTFAFFMSAKALADATIVMRSYLKEKGIEYSNEFSEAGWVYRFVINQKVETHNQLLEQFKHNQL
ncbi:MAG: hypothetical protein ACJARG_000054 [Arcticibacterium sp.]|jgi:hypothetical protein